MPPKRNHRRPQQQSSSYMDIIIAMKNNPRSAEYYHAYLEALKQHRIWQSQGQYRWAQKWQAHANALYASALSRRTLDEIQVFYRKHPIPKNE